MSYKNICLPLLLLCGIHSLIAQSKRDHTWILGYPTLIPGQPNTEQFGGMFMKFSEDQYTVENFDIVGGPVSAVANDEDGNLLFYTNGCSIYNSAHEVMENGSDINMGAADYDYVCYQTLGISYIRSGNVVLPKPGSNDVCYLFHLRFIETSDTSGLNDALLFTEVDMGENNGTGKVILKNQIAVADSLHDALAVCRHGNGRDWWIVIPRGINRDFWKILFSPEGIKETTLQSFPPPYPPFTVQYEFPIDEPPYVRYFSPDEYEFESWAGQAIFSPDGTKYCRVIRAGVIEIYDFDRCSGEMALRRTIPLPPYIAYPEIPVTACGLAVSPNSRYLYFNNNEALYQFDMCPEHLENGNFELIQEWDRFLQDSFFATNFFQMRNAPDGKIYMAAANSVRSLHVIHEPDKPGKACRFEQRGVDLPRYTNWVINYFPNFNLYDLADSPCDTLGIDDPNPPKPTYTFETLRIFPNPASREVTLFVPQCDAIRVKVWNIAGQLVEDIPFVPGMEAYPLDVSGWASGAYIIAAYIDAQKPVMQKIIVAH